METKFQTSFIPKKPLPPVGGVTPNVGLNNPKPRRQTSLFFNIAILIFILSVGAAGALYAWEYISISQQESYKKELADRQKQFNPGLITELRAANTKIDIAKRLLNTHLAISNIFGIISQFTVESIRFLDLTVIAPTASNQSILISMDGQGLNLSAVAFQGDVLASLEKYGLSNLVKSPTISEPKLETGGSVAFGFSATIDPAGLIYKKPVQQTP